MKTLKKLRLLDSQAVQGDILTKNQQKSFMGGYGGFTWCYVYGESCHCSPQLGYFACETNDVTACYLRCSTEAAEQHKQTVCCVCGVE